MYNFEQFNYKGSITLCIKLVILSEFHNLFILLNLFVWFLLYTTCRPSVTWQNELLALDHLE